MPNWFSCDVICCHSLGIEDFVSDVILSLIQLNQDGPSRNNLYEDKLLLNYLVDPVNYLIDHVNYLVDHVNYLVDHVKDLFFTSYLFISQMF